MRKLIKVVITQAEDRLRQPSFIRESKCHFDIMPSAGTLWKRNPSGGTLEGTCPKAGERITASKAAIPQLPREHQNAKSHQRCSSPPPPRYFFLQHVLGQQRFEQIADRGGRYSETYIRDRKQRQQRDEGHGERYQPSQHQQIAKNSHHHGSNRQPIQPRLALP